MKHDITVKWPPFKNGHTMTGQVLWTLEFPIFVGWKFHFFKITEWSMWFPEKQNIELWCLQLVNVQKTISSKNILVSSLQHQWSIITHYITSDSGETENVPSPTNCDRTSPKYRAAVPVWSAAVLHIWCWLKLHRLKHFCWCYSTRWRRWRAQRSETTAASVNFCFHCYQITSSVC